jgi:hypothetical protein
LAALIPGFYPWGGLGRSGWPVIPLPRFVCCNALLGAPLDRCR